MTEKTLHFQRICLIAALFIYSYDKVEAQSDGTINHQAFNVDTGWAGNSVNAVIFRKNSLVTYDKTQFISYYDSEGYVILGKRKRGTITWTFKKTAFKGNIKDAHNSISMMVDGYGYLHLAWDHHNNPLNYARSLQPLSLEMSGKIAMTGKAEKSVTYPEFYSFKNNDLLFLYRDGASGNGNLVINTYNASGNEWKQLHTNLIDGEKQRNAYWQAYVDHKDIIHLSWVWRESADVSSNHDICYARSTDGGITWEKSSGEKYSLPITAANAEYVLKIPENSDLINQTTMSADGEGNPVIASYWREKNTDIPQYHILYRKEQKWEVENIAFRKTAFSLSGVGTKQIPISRPLVLAGQNGKKNFVALVFRDAERKNRVSVALKRDYLNDSRWSVFDLANWDLGAWEPTFDTELWKQKQTLSLYIQKVAQADQEGMSDLQPQMIRVLELNFHRNIKGITNALYWVL